MASELGPRNVWDSERREIPQGITPVLIAGLPGKMATAAAEAIAQSLGYTLTRVALTSPRHDCEIRTVGEEKVALRSVSPLSKRLSELQDYHGNRLMAVDFTTSNSALPNVEAYAQAGISFVMGTTGGDERGIAQAVENSEVCAVVAPNMAMQIVAFQSFLDEFSETHRGLLEGAELNLVESHQQGKGDTTSGTAKAMVSKPDGSQGYFNLLGIPFSVGQIEKIREPEEQLKLGVPESALEGHGWHTYVVSSEEPNPGIDVLFDGLRGFLENSRVFVGYQLVDAPPSGPNNITTNLNLIKARIGKPELRSQIKEECHCLAVDSSVGFSLYHTQGKLLVITHNVSGRDVYAQGTLRALGFLKEQIEAGARGRVFSMMDVLAAQEA